MSKRKPSAGQPARAAAKPRPRRPREPAPVAEAAEQARRHRVAEAAYYRALARGFEGGDPVEDWLAAEREIAARDVDDDVERPPESRDHGRGVEGAGMETA